MSAVKFKLAAGTNVGLLRQNNEDNFIVCPDLSSSQWLIPQDDAFADLGPYGALLVVADGMGGMNAGEVASAIAVETIQKLFTAEALEPVVNDDKLIQEFMTNVVKSADLNILNRSENDSSTQGMGTTVVMAWILGRRAYVCWCGDSRCYVLNHRNGLIRLSKDHSFVQELVDRGELAPEYASDHPLSNVITRCLGNTEKRAEPDVRVYELYDGDTIMLCSDGLSGLCQDELIANTIDEFSENPMECKNELISAALSNGGHDNVTVAVCKIHMDSDEELDKETEQGDEVSADVTDSSEDVTDKTESSTDEKDKGHDAESNEKEEPEELSATLRNYPQKNRSHKSLWIILLLVIVALGCCVYLYDNNDVFRQKVIDAYGEIQDVISYLANLIKSKQ